MIKYLALMGNGMGNGEEDHGERSYGRRLRYTPQIRTNDRKKTMVQLMNHVTPVEWDEWRTSLGKS